MHHVFSLDVKAREDPSASTVTGKDQTSKVKKKSSCANFATSEKLHLVQTHCRHQNML
jgi:hypothetical protein